MSPLKGGAIRAILGTMLVTGSAVSFGAGIFFDSTSVANNAATRANWLAGAGVAAGTFFEDFESIPLDTDLHGISGLLPGGLVIRDTSSAHHAYVRGSSSYFGGSNPIGTRAVAHNEQAYLELDFSASPMDYVGGFDIDHTAGTVIVTYVGNGTETYQLESAGAAEFWGVLRNDMPRIVKLQFDVSGDGEWGIDNLEYGPVPEPASAAAVGLGILALLYRKTRK